MKRLIWPAWPGGDHISVYETRTLGCTHAQIGGEIARDWNLPVEIREGVARHHETSGRIDPQSLTGIIQLAEYLTDGWGCRLSMEWLRPCPRGCSTICTKI